MSLITRHSVLAVDLGGTKVSQAIVDDAGRIRARTTEPVDLSSTRAPVDQICRLAARLATPRTATRRIGGSRRLRATWSAVGVAVPGLVRRSGTVWAPNLPGWERVPLARLLERRLRAPVVVESDRNAAVIGEAWRGAARGKRDVIALIVGTGIGAGIISEGRLVRGAHELSGCAGWMVLSEEERGEFGRYGGLEAVAAGPAIVRAVREALGKGSRSMLSRWPQKTLTAEDVARAARQGDHLARQAFARSGQSLGFAVANLISLFDPEVIVLGGGVAGAADLFFDTLTRTALVHCQPLAARQVRIRLSRLGNDASLLGAARLALDMAVARRS